MHWSIKDLPFERKKTLRPDTWSSISFVRFLSCFCQCSNKSSVASISIRVRASSRLSWWACHVRTSLSASAVEDLYCNVHHNLAKKLPWPYVGQLALSSISASFSALHALEWVSTSIWALSSRGFSKAVEKSSFICLCRASSEFTPSLDDH